MPIDLKDGILNAVGEQISDLQSGLEKQAEIAAILAELDRLMNLLSGFPANAVIGKLLPVVVQQIESIQSGKTGLAEFGTALVDLYAVQQELTRATGEWIAAKQGSAADAENLARMILDVIRQIRQLLNYRPDVGAILDDLAAIKHLQGGPADAESFHDFQVLQVAFKSVWLHVFNGELKSAAEDLYNETVRLYEDAGLPMPNFEAIDDIEQLRKFIAGISKDLGVGPRKNNGPVTIGPPPVHAPPPSIAVNKYFPEAATVWSLLSGEQQALVVQDAQAMDGFITDPKKYAWAIQEIKDRVAYIVKHPLGSASRLTRLIAEIGEHLSEPYAFDVFAPDSYNFGLMITYRQKWTPGEYQAGDLVATIPLAPGETRKFSKKRVVKRARAEKEVERSMLSRSTQFSETSRAESEIIQKAVTATNFKLTAHGSFNIGVGSIDSTTEFAASQDLQSSLNKKAFHESTLRAAEEYRLERSLEIDTTTSFETEETVSGEVSNPNNEITVTYLFYELQRRFKIREFLYRVRPVILVAQEVPAPHEIDEAWLVEHQWIIARVLLDDSLRPALEYLSSGFAGEELSVEVLRAHWETQLRLTKGLEGQVNDLSAKRDWLREALVSTDVEEATAKAFTMPTALKVFTFGLAPDPAQMQADRLEAARKGYEARLQYSEQALADAQDKLRQASDSLRQATKEYAAALQNQYSRHVGIDQLRVHVKQNIIYYMQAIWDHEPPDQRFFRLYNKRVVCPTPEPGCAPSYTAEPHDRAYRITARDICKPVLTVGGAEHDLVEMADLDSPLGYKGNYIIFPLRDKCYLTAYMVMDFFDDGPGVRDADGSDDFDIESFDQKWREAAANPDKETRDRLKKQLTDYIEAVRRGTDEIIVPTGQLFIEALPGSHPLLEDFKLLHRFEDVRKVKAEVRHAELENLRLAARLLAGQDKPELLSDPEIEKQVVIEGNTPVIGNP